MNLDEVLPAGSVALDVAIPDKSGVISRAAEMLSPAAGIPAAAIEAALFAREALGSTGVGAGLGLPHARLHSLRGTHAVFLRLAAPIDFTSIDGNPVDLVCAVVARDEPNADLLTAVAALSRVLRNAQSAAALREKADPEQVRKVLRSIG